MANFIEHTACPHCSSSDAYGVYDDGSGYCFSCQAYDGENGEGETKTKGYEMNSDLVSGTFSCLSTRGIDFNTCKKYNYEVGEVNGQPAQIANYYQNRQVVAQHIRYPDKSFIWKGNAKKLELFGQSLFNHGGPKLTITEGEIDCLTISQCFDNKYPVVSVPSGAQSAAKYIAQNLTFVESFKEIILAFDDDEPGKKAISDCIAILTPGKAKVMKYDGCKDANELFKEKGKQAVVQCCYSAQVSRPDGLVSGQDIWDEICKPINKGLDLPYPELNKMICGVRPGELYVFTAGSGIGKSTLVKEIMAHLLITHKETVGIMALEESTNKTGRGLLGIHLSKPLDKPDSDIPQDELRKAYDEVLNNDRIWFYDHWGSTDVESLINYIRYMVIALNCKFVMLDHLSIVVSGLSSKDTDESERKTIDIMMTKLRKLVEETGVGIIAVSHVRRKNEGKSYNEGKQLSLTDLRGSASIEQLSDVVIGIERNQQGSNPNTSTIRVLKNRPLGITGKADTLEYNPMTGRLLPNNYNNIEVQGGTDDSEAPFPMETFGAEYHFK